MKLRVYLDTSIVSAYYDERVTDRQQETQALWGRFHEFEVSTSALTIEELQQTPDVAQRDQLLALVKPLAVIPVTADMQALAQVYIEADIFTMLTFNDALHVAIAALARQDVLLSWNFKHLVNRRRRAMVNELHVLRGLPTMEIVAPPEL